MALVLRPSIPFANPPWQRIAGFDIHCVDRHCLCVRSGRAGIPVLLGYLAVFSASLAGYAGIAPWAIAAVAIALAAISRSQYEDLYKSGQDLGQVRAIGATTLRSLLNALIAAGLAYGAGWLLRVI